MLRKARTIIALLLSIVLLCTACGSSDYSINSDMTQVESSVDSIQIGANKSVDLLSELGPYYVADEYSLTKTNAYNSSAWNVGRTCVIDNIVYSLSVSNIYVDQDIKNEIAVFDLDLMEERERIDIPLDEDVFLDSIFTVNGILYGEILSRVSNEFSVCRIDIDNNTWEVDDRFSSGLRTYSDLVDCVRTDEGIAFLVLDDYFYSLVYYKNDEDVPYVWKLDYYDIYYVENMYVKDSNTIVVLCNHARFIEVDLTSGRPVMQESGVQYVTVNDCCSNECFCTYGDGLYIYESEHDYYRRILDYSMLNFDATKMEAAEILHYGDDGIIIGYMEYSFDEENWVDIHDTDIVSEYKICRFVQCQPNNPDREVLKLVSDTNDMVLLDNIRNFNNTNEDYYVIYDIISPESPEYYNDAPQPLFYDDVYYSWGDADSFISYINYFAEVERWQLSVLTNPRYDYDIVFGFGDKELVDTSQVCVDLMEYIDKNDFDTQKLYWNVVEANKKEDKLYMIPFTFSVNAIVVNSSEELDYEQDISYQEYYNMLQDAGLDYDPMKLYVSDLETFVELFSNQFDEFIDLEQSDVLFREGEFEKIIQYSISNALSLDQEGYYSEVSMSYADYVSITDFFSLVVPYGFEQDIPYLYVFSIPTEFGDSLKANTVQGIGISKFSDSKDSAWEFIEYLLSDDMVSAEYVDSICINKQCEEIHEQYFVDICAVYGIDYSEYYDEYKAIVGSVSRVTGCDYVLTAVLINSIYDPISGNISSIKNSQAMIMDLIYNHGRE